MNKLTYEELLLHQEVNVLIAVFVALDDEVSV